MSHHESNAVAAPAGAVLEVSGLTVGFRQGSALRTVVRDVSFSLRRGELLALVGESGSGKSVTALAVMGLLPEGIAAVSGGSVRFAGQDLGSLSPEERRRLRGRRLSMIFQEPMTALNPVMTIGQQLAETLLAHGQCGRREARARAVRLLEEVGIPAAATRLRDYPHQLSGGQRQRVMIAMALACRPELLIADEPTTALDVTVQAQIMELLNRLRRQLGTAVLFITHNLALVREQADRVAVMVSGQLVETAPAAELFRRPCHPYTRLLLRSVPSAAGRHAALAAIDAPRPGVSPHPAACAFATRCPLVQDTCLTEPPGDQTPAPDHHVRCRRPGMFGVALAADGASEEPPPAVGDGPRAVLEARGLQVWFPRRAGLLGSRRAPVRAVDGVDLTLRAGETLALVGESGCGKTTVGKALVRLLRPTGGSVRLGDGIELTRLDEHALRPLRRRIQMIFQDPFSSLDPRLMAGESLLEGLDAQRIGTPAERRAAVEALLGDVGLPPEAAGRYPHQFSGGQRQRLGLARALAVAPDIIVCDECTSCAGCSAGWGSPTSSSPMTSAWSATSPTASPSCTSGASWRRAPPPRSSPIRPIPTPAPSSRPRRASTASPAAGLSSRETSPAPAAPPTDAASTRAAHSPPTSAASGSRRGDLSRPHTGRPATARRLRTQREISRHGWTIGQRGIRLSACRLCATEFPVWRLISRSRRSHHTC